MPAGAEASLSTMTAHTHTGPAMAAQPTSSIAQIFIGTLLLGARNSESRHRPDAAAAVGAAGIARAAGEPRIEIELATLQKLQEVLEILIDDVGFLESALLIETIGEGDEESGAG
jgi:hypothetical protein